MLHMGLFRGVHCRRAKKKHGGVPSSSQLSPPCPRTNAPPRGAVAIRTLVPAPQVSNPASPAKKQLAGTVELSHPMLPAGNKPTAPMRHNPAIPSFRLTANYNPVLP